MPGSCIGSRVQDRVGTSFAPYKLVKPSLNYCCVFFFNFILKKTFSSQPQSLALISWFETDSFGFTSVIGS